MSTIISFICNVVNQGTDDISNSQYLSRIDMSTKINIIILISIGREKNLTITHSCLKSVLTYYFRPCNVTSDNVLNPDHNNRTEVVKPSSLPVS